MKAITIEDLRNKETELIKRYNNEKLEVFKSGILQQIEAIRIVIDLFKMEGKNV